MISLFGTSYVCEQLFSRMKNVKPKARTRITDVHLGKSLRITTTTIGADIDKLVKNKQMSNVSSRLSGSANLIKRVFLYRNKLLVISIKLCLVHAGERSQNVKILKIICRNVSTTWKTQLIRFLHAFSVSIFLIT